MKEKTSLNYDCYIVLRLSYVLLGIVLAAMMMSPIVMAYYADTTTPSMGQILGCRQTILGFGQKDIIPARSSSRLRYPTDVIVKAQYPYWSEISSTETAFLSVQHV